MRFKKLRIVLIKPSKYDDDGYVIRFWKGVLPSNTLNVLNGLTEEVKNSRVFGDLGIEIVTFDETAERLPVRKMIHKPRAYWNLMSCFFWYKNAALIEREHPWQEAYSRLRHSLPSKYRLVHAKFDALSNRAVYSRQDLQKFWANTVRQLRALRFWNIHPWKVTTAFIKDLSLTTSFAFTVRASLRESHPTDSNSFR